MGRQNKQDQRDRSSSGGAADLLNFHFSSGPPQQQPNNNNGRRRNNNNNQNNHHYNNNNNRKRNQQDWSAVRRKANSHMFNLHSSTDHAFVITRHGLKQQQYSFSGSDEGVSWESVRMVKVLVPSEQPEATCCPICLDSLVCARITKCGHVFDLACLLHHVQVHAQSNPYTHVKCPCCAVPLHVPDLRPVVLISSLPPRIHQRMKLVKLHRTKDCPTPYLPLPDQPKRSSNHAAPCVGDKDAPFCRFNYVNISTYREHLEANKVELQTELSKLTTATHPRLKYQADVEAIFVTSALDLVQKEVLKAMEEAEQENELAENYSSIGSGVCQAQPPHLVASNYEFVTAPLPNQQQQQRKETLGDTIVDPDTGDLLNGENVRHRSESMGSEGESITRRYRGDSIGSYASSMDASQGQGISWQGSGDAEDYSAPNSPCSQNPKPAKGNNKRNNNKKGRKKPLEFPKAKMYLDNEGSTQFYQCEDGQLCFLARFNMSCLLSDFSPKVPDEESIVGKQPVSSMNFWQRRSLLPLPDTIEGEILEIENVHLTPDLRKRMPVLSHLPLYTDIQFVELDLNSLLSNETKRKFKADFEKRRKKRQGKVKAEKREDRIARLKEEARINELKARMQRVDPNDEFFQVSLPEEPLELTGDAFGPAMSSGTTTRVGNMGQAAAIGTANATMNFSNVCQLGTTLAVNAESNFPALGSSPSNFPALGSSPPTTRKSQPPAVSGWGNPRSNQPQSAPSWGGQSKVTSQPRANPVPDSSVGVVSKQPPMPGGKKKAKGKKIVLFSTGGQRGTSY